MRKGKLALSRIFEPSLINFAAIKQRQTYYKINQRRQEAIVISEQAKTIEFGVTVSELFLPEA